MEPTLVQALQAQQSAIRGRWETLLRAEPARSALADPDILVRLFEVTLGDLFTRLQARPVPRPAPDGAIYSRIRAGCGCGRNPLVTYFLTGEQALLETLAALDGTGAAAGTAAAELHFVLRQIARQEVESFCSLCQHRAHGGGAACNVPRPRHWRGQERAGRRPALADVSTSSHRRPLAPAAQVSP